MPIPVQKFGIIPGDQSNPLSSLLRGLQYGYQQGLANQQTRQKMRHDETLQKALQEKLAKEQQSRAQIGELFGHAASEGQEGTGFLGGKVTPDVFRQQIAEKLMSSGHEREAMQALYGNREYKTSMERNLEAMDYKPGTAPYINAARAMYQSRMLPSNVKQARYASPTAAALIKRVDDNNVIDSVIKFSGPEGWVNKKSCSRCKFDWSV